jgi:hypothetical protein
MSGEFSPQWRPEPQPSTVVERLLQKAAAELSWPIAPKLVTHN